MSTNLSLIKRGDIDIEMGILLTLLLYVSAEFYFRLLLEITTFFRWYCICMHGLLLELGTTQMEPVKLLCGGKTLFSVTSPKDWLNWMEQ